MPSALLFMKIVGQGNSAILGESQINLGAIGDNYQGQIELTDWSWDVKRNKGKDKSGDAAPSVFSFSKPLDRSTTALLTYLRTGREIPSAEIRLVDANLDKFQLTVLLQQVRVTKYGLDGDMDERVGSLKEKWDFDYRSIRFDYRPSKTLPTNERGLLQVTMPRSDDASLESAGDDSDEKIREVLGKMPLDKRKSLWSRVGQDLDKLGSKPEVGKSDGKGKGK